MRADADLNPLRVAVTRGTSGLGLALVRRLAARGSRVAFVARNPRTVERVAKETGACGVVGDVGRKEDIYALALQIAGNLGGLDALINNASSLGPTPLAPAHTPGMDRPERAPHIHAVRGRQGVASWDTNQASFGRLAPGARTGRRR